MRIIKIMPFIFFLGLHHFLPTAAYCRNTVVFSAPFLETRYKKNFVTGNEKADPDLFRIKAGTEGIQASVYGKKKDGGNFELTSFKTGFSPFRGNKLMIHFFYGSLGYNGFASRLRNPPGKSSSVVYYPVSPTKSLFFSQSTASGRTNLAADMFFGNWRLAFCGDIKGYSSSPFWFSGGWVGSPGFAPSASLSVLFFGGKSISEEKNDGSWFPAYHRENQSGSLSAGSEISVKTKHFGSSLFISGTDGILRPDGFQIRADAFLHGKYGRLSAFYSKTDRDYAAVSGNRVTVLEKRGISPYAALTVNRKMWLRFTAGAVFCELLETGEKEYSGDISSFYAGGYLSAATLTSYATVRIKKGGDRITLEGSAKSAALLSRRLVLEASMKSIFAEENRNPEETKITGSVTFRSTLYRSIGISAERLREEEEKNYTVSALFTERLSVGRLKTDFSCKISAHTDDRKFSGNITVKTLLK